MFTKVSVLVPTRGRVKRLQTMLTSFETTVPGGAELIFRVDLDDEPTQEFLEVTRHRVLVGPRHQGYDSLATFFNEMMAESTGDVLMCGNDDMVFRTSNWPALLLEAANRYPDGLFDLGVTTLNAPHYPFSIISRRAAETLGFFWDPRIFWGDIYLRDIMAAFDRLVMVPEVVIDHDWAGWKPDRTYLEALQPGETAKDIVRRFPNYWRDTHAPAVAEAVEKLRGLYVSTRPVEELPGRVRIVS